MRKTSAAKLAEENDRLTTSSVVELVKWHQELRKSLEKNKEGEEAEDKRILLIKVQSALVSANSSQVDLDNEHYKKLIKHIQEQKKRL